MKNISQMKTCCSRYSKDIILRCHTSKKPSNLEYKLVPKNSFIDCFEKSNPFYLRKSKSTLNREKEIIEKKKVLINSTVYYKIVGIPINSLNKLKRNYLTERNYTNEKRFKNKSDILQLWKKVITEQILLNRMKSKIELYRLKAEQHKHNSIYEYLEITPCLKSVSLLWDRWLSFDNQPKDDKILEALSKGKSIISILSHSSFKTSFFTSIIKVLLLSYCPEYKIQIVLFKLATKGLLYFNNNIMIIKYHC